MTDDRDDRMVRLLEEMRDLQRQHLEHYKEALKNQTEAIALQRELQVAARRRLKIIPGLIAIVLLLIVVVLVLIMRVVSAWSR